MDNAWQFVRHILPGAVYGVLTFVGLILLCPEWIVEHSKDLGGKDSAIPLVVAGIFASGALGYVFATIHHSVSWYFPCDANVLDNRPLLNSPATSGLMKELVARNYVSTDDQALLTRKLSWWCLLKVHDQKQVAMAISIGMTLPLKNVSLNWV